MSQYLMFEVPYLFRVITFFATLKLLNNCIICCLVLLGDECESKTYCRLLLCGYRDDFQM